MIGIKNLYGKVVRVFCCMFVMSIVSAGPAHAYIDPVTTSVVLQALVGGVAASLVAIRGVRDRLLGFFRRSHRNKGSSEGTKPE